MGCTSPSVQRCVGDSTTLGSGLSCDRAKALVSGVDVLAARSMPGKDRQRVYAWLDAAHKKDAPGVEAKLDAFVAAMADMRGSKGLEAAEKRSRFLYQIKQGEGPIGAGDGDLWSVYKLQTSVWETSDTHKLALSEMDVEGWIRYASLCHESQHRGPLRASIATRVSLYNLVRARFREANREEQLAMVAIGPFWHEVSNRWQAASYREQQLWITSAPLPPLMNATPMAFVSAVVDGDVKGHARTLHDTLGPFHLTEPP